MKVFVQRATEVNEATAIPIPSYAHPDRTVTGESKTRLDVEVMPIVDGDEANWKASVGRTLEVHGIAPDGWWSRCEAYYTPEPGSMHVDRGPERCAFPSLRGPTWYMHPDEHESLTWGWGNDEVRTLKEERRSG